MKKILILNWKDIKHPEVGGAEIIVYELAKRLVKDQYEVTWFCREFERGKKEETIDGIKIVRRGNILTMYLWAPIYYWQNEKPDLVIDMSNTIYWQTPLWTWKSKKVAYLNQLAKEVFFYEYPLPIAVLGSVFEKLQYLSYKKTPFIIYSRSTKEDLVSMGVPRKNVVGVFPLGIDHSRYCPGKKSKTPLFICVSRLVRMKRTDLAIRAMGLVRERYPEAKLIIMGHGYERKRLEDLRNKLKLKKNVYFLDENILFFEKSVKDKKVAMMQKAWALVFPSVKEGWGMTVTECAACGTPTIATNVTGLKDSVRDGETGILVSKNPTPAELSGAMIGLIENSKERKRLGKNAVKYAGRFSWEKSYNKFKQLVEKLK